MFNNFTGMFIKKHMAHPLQNNWTALRRTSRNQHVKEETTAKCAVTYTCTDLYSTSHETRPIDWLLSRETHHTHMVVICTTTQSHITSAAI
jgi:hypothetical protein